VEKDSAIHTFNEDQAARFLNEALVKEYNVNLGGGSVCNYEKRPISLQFRTFFTLAFYSGCRRGELVALNWNDVNIEAKTIRIDQAVSRCNDGLFLKDPKTKAGRRTIKLPAICFALLQEWKTEQIKTCMALGSAWKGFRGHDFDNNPVFIQEDGKRMNVCTPTSKFKKILKAYNETVPEEDKLPMIRLHDLRHTNASYMIASGIDLETAAKRLGHSKPSFTLDVYGHALEENDERAAEVLNTLFSIA
jgi:integrase